MGGLRDGSFGGSGRVWRTRASGGECRRVVETAIKRDQ